MLTKPAESFGKTVAITEMSTLRTRISKDTKHIHDAIVVVEQLGTNYKATNAGNQDQLLKAAKKYGTVESSLARLRSAIVSDVRLSGGRRYSPETVKASTQFRDSVSAFEAYCSGEAPTRGGVIFLAWLTDLMKLHSTYTQSKRQAMITIIEERLQIKGWGQL